MPPHVQLDLPRRLTIAAGQVPRELVRPGCCWLSAAREHELGLQVLRLAASEKSTASMSARREP